MSSIGGKMNNQTQTNINAAKLLGLTAREQGGGVFIDYEDGDYYGSDLFLDAEIREQVVIALGEKHGVTICSAPMKRWAFFIKDATNDCVFDTYLDALEAALESIKES